MTLVRRLFKGDGEWGHDNNPRTLIMSPAGAIADVSAMSSALTVGSDSASV